MTTEPPSWTGVVTFYSSQHAVRAEKVLRERGFNVKLIPGPKEISPSCGVALAFEYPDSDGVRRALEEARVPVEGIHSYHVPGEHASRRWGLRRKSEQGGTG